jgi:polar amino acid transport system permease protein
MIQFSSVHVFYLLEAARWTIALSLIAFAGGAVLGLMLALARVSLSPVLRAAAAGYIQIVQGTPLLILLFLSYFGLSLVGYRLDPLVAAGLSLTFYVGAFLGEIWRASIQSVPRTQWEASDCLGLNRFYQYTYIILPQAMRIATPPTVGFMVQVVKNTSLASVIGFVELTRAGQIVNNSTFQPFLVFLLVGAIYFAICYPLSVASRYLERKLHVGK